MERIAHEDKTFEEVVYAEKVVKGREFQSCSFIILLGTTQAPLTGKSSSQT